jgi:hypothetical protein
MSGLTSRVTCQGTRTCGVGEVVDDEPRDVPRHPDAQRRRSISIAAVRQVVTTHNGMTGHTARASATDWREVEHRDGASGCTT